MISQLRALRLYYVGLVCLFLGCIIVAGISNPTAIVFAPVASHMANPFLAMYLYKSPAKLQDD